MAHDQEEQRAQAAETGAGPPARRGRDGDLERPPGQHALAVPSSEPSEELPTLEPARDFGWLLTMLSAVGALLGSWHFPKDAEGMWAGYWVSGCATVAILAALALRSSLPAALGSRPRGSLGECSSCWACCATPRPASP